MVQMQERRIKQQEEVAKNERETAVKMAARAYAQSYLDDLIPSVFAILTEQRFFFDRAERGARRDSVFNSLLFRVSELVCRYSVSRSVGNNGALRTRKIHSYYYAHESN